MLTYNMDVDPKSRWLRATLSAAAKAQPFYCSEAGHFLGRQHFSTARTDKESFLFFYTVQGAGLIEQDGRQVELGTGQGLLLNCRTPQSYCTAPGHSCWHHYWVHLDGSGVHALQQLLQPEDTPGQLTPAALPQLQTVELLEGILQGIQRDDSAALVDTGLLLHRLTAALADSLLRAETSHSNREMILQTAQYIRSHCSEDLSLDDLISRTHISKGYFIRLFRQQMGTTPYNYLVCARINQAKELLVMTDLPVKEILTRVGFDSESHFSYRFRSMTGQSPLQYRKSAWQAR